MVEVSMDSLLTPTLLIDNLRLTSPLLTTLPDRPGVLWVESESSNQTESLIYHQMDRPQRTLITASKINQVLHSYVNPLGSPSSF